MTLVGRPTKVIDHCKAYFAPGEIFGGTKVVNFAPQAKIFGVNFRGNQKVSISKKAN